MSFFQRAPRERTVTRAIHRLFWQATLRKRGYLPASVLFFWPGTILQHILIPLQVAYGIQAIVQRNFHSVTSHIIIILVLSMAYNVCSAVGTLIFNRNASDGGAYVQRQVFANYLQKDYEFYSNAFFGSLGAQASRLRDAFNDYNRLVMFDVARQGIIVIGSIAMIAYKSPALALLTTVCMLLVLSYTIISSTWRLKWRRRVGETSSELAGIVGDALSHADTVKSFASEKQEEKHLEEPLGRWQHAQQTSWDLFIPANIGRTLLSAGTTGGLLLLAAHLYQNHTITIATVALVQLYSIKLIAVTQDIAEIIKTYEGIMGAAYQPVQTMLVQATVVDKPEPKRLATSTRLDIRFQNTSFHYPDAAKDATAITGFNLDIQHGQKVGLVGYSGSGKTTLTKLLLRFMDVTDGSIQLGGMDIRDIAQADLRGLIAYVPQEPLLFHRTIAENIRYGKPGATKKALQAAAKLAYVDEFVAEWPQGYATLVGERGVKLSGGQRQRVAIARALLKDAPILVLDEATSALDSRSEQLIQKALWRLMEDRTALVIAHRLSTIQRMDKIVVMDKGKVVQCGTHQELLKQKRGVYAKLWAHQSGGYITDPDAAPEK